MKIKAVSSMLLPVSICLTILFYCLPSAAQNTTPTIVFQGATLIDGTGRDVINDSVLVVRDGKIVAVGKAGSVSIPKGAEVKMVRGKTIMPLLNVLIGHLGMTATVGEKPECLCYSEDILRTEIQRILAYGVGSYLSLGQDQDLIYQVRQGQRDGIIPGTRIFTAGRGLGSIDYPHHYENGLDQYRPATTDQARAFVREIAAHHPDFIKIWVDDDFGASHKLQPFMYQAIIDEAHKQHLRVIAHEYSLADAKALVDAGVDGLAHSVQDQPVDADFINALKARGTFLVPSLSRQETKIAYGTGPKWLDDPFFQAGLNVGVLEYLRSDTFKDKVRLAPSYVKNEAKIKLADELGKKNLKPLYDAGVKIGFGSDSGLTAETYRFPGFQEHRELQLLVEAGLTPMQAIVSATRTTAELLVGPNVDFGTLLPGKQADFMVLDANPLDDIHNTEKLSAVWQGGVFVRPITAAERH